MMKILSQNIGLYPKTQFDFLGSADELLFLNIETSGLSPHNAQILLIGTVTFTPHSDHQYEAVLTQFLAESFSDELNCLKAFFSFASSCKCLVSFYGTRFDLRFIQDCANQYNLPFPLDGFVHMDLYLHLKPMQKLLSLEHMTLPAIESLLGIVRIPNYSKEALAKLCENYSKQTDIASQNSLLLHNTNDLKSILAACNLLIYSRLFFSDFSSFPIRFLLTDMQFEIHVSLPESIPFPLKLQKDEILLSIQKDELALFISLYQGEAKFFFSDYQNYYYLPAEDTAIHKSIAAFVDRQHRKKATRKTAYIKKFSTYLPIFGEFSFPEFKLEYNASRSYVEARAFQHPKELQQISSYLQNVLKFLGLRP